MAEEEPSYDFPGLDVDESSELPPSPTRDRTVASKHGKKDGKLLGKVQRNYRLLSETEFKPIEELVSFDVPTRYLYIANVGAGYNPGTALEALFLQYAPDGFHHILSYKSRPYCIAVYDTPENAEYCRRKLNYRRPQPWGKTLMLDFCKVPPVVGGTFTGGEDVGQLLFSDGPVALPPGAVLIRNFLTVEEEAALIAKVESYQEQFEELTRRRVIHFGYEFVYKIRSVNRSESHGSVAFKDLSPWESVLADNLVARIQSTAVAKAPGLSVEAPFVLNQLTINDYPSGGGIPPHVDTHSAFLDPIVSLSLGSGVLMEFRHPDGRQHNVYIQPRSLLLMSGEARLLWNHGITPRKSDQFGDKKVGRGRRISLTFRAVRPLSLPCRCPYPAQCDRWKDVSSDTATSLIEKKYVVDVYDTIAEHFSTTRHSPWPRIKAFLESLPEGSLVADVGCGNGRYLGVAPHVAKLGCDRSVKLVEIGAKLGFETLVCDAKLLPYRSQAFDVAMCIAVLHHIPSLESRLQMLRELKRIVRIGGRVVVFVWSMEQEDRTFGQQDLFVPWHLPTDQSGQAAKTGEASAELGEIHKVDCDAQPSPDGTYTVYKRFYHVFKNEELKDLFLRVDDFEILQQGLEKGNFYIIAERMK